MLYVLYVLYLTRQAAEPPLSPGSLLYVLYVLYLTRQAAEPPLSPGSLLYVLYVLYVLYARNLWYMCYIGPYSTYSTYSKEPGESGCSVACLVRYSTYSTYSKEPGESGCSVACLVRYSTYSTYSKEPGESGCSAGWRSVRAAFCMVFAWFLHDMACPTASTPSAPHSCPASEPQPDGFAQRLLAELHAGSNQKMVRACF